MAAVDPGGVYPRIALASACWPYFVRSTGQAAAPGSDPLASGQGLAIIIPTRGLTPALSARCAGLHALFPKAELIVVEPCSGGATGGLAAPRQDGPLLRVQAIRGRGTQCNAGARAARGELLLFLHDDTDLPAAAPRLIAAAFSRPEVLIACFRLRFDHRHWLLGLYAWCSRVDSFFTTFGDQGLLLRRAFYTAIGGFPDWPLFEDVELARRARRCTRIHKLPAAVTTSAVRYLQHGILRQQVRNALLMVRFLLGASPQALRAAYDPPPAAGPGD